MRQQNRNTEKEKKETTISRLEKIHPHKMLLYLATFGSSLIFLFMIVAFSFSIAEEGFVGFKMPKAFVVSLVLLLLSSYTISKALPAFKKDNISELKKTLGLTLMFGLSFTISQYVGWYELNQSGVYLSGKTSGAYLYVISGLHVLHLAGALVFITMAYTKVSGISRDPVKALILITDPYEELKIEMLSFYWHFIDALWVVLFFYFLFSF
jgi:cytochrome c oxidase subunit 3